MLLVTLGEHEFEEIDYRKINVETNSGIAVSPERPHWNGDIKKYWHSSDAFIINFEKIDSTPHEPAPNFSGPDTALHC